MTRNCSVCDHPHRPEIDAALVAGRSTRDIAAAHGLNYQAIRRHRLNHLPLTIRAAAAAALERVDTGEAAPAPQIDAALAHGLPEAVAPATPAIAPVHPVRARQRTRGIQLEETPPAPPVEQSATTPAGTAPGAGVFNVYAQSVGLLDRAMVLLETAERAGDVKTALTAIRETRGIYEHLSRLEERHQASATHAPLDTSPEWHRTRTAIVTALAEFPEARVAVAEALVGVGALH